MLTVCKSLVSTATDQAFPRSKFRNTSLKITPKRGLRSMRRWNRKIEKQILLLKKVILKITFFVSRLLVKDIVDSDSPILKKTIANKLTLFSVHVYQVR